MLVIRIVWLLFNGISILNHSVVLSLGCVMSRFTSLNGRFVFTPMITPPPLFVVLPANCGLSLLLSSNPGICGVLSVGIIFVSWTANISISCLVMKSSSSSFFDRRPSAFHCSIFKPLRWAAGPILAYVV